MSKAKFVIAIAAALMVVIGASVSAIGVPNPGRTTSLRFNTPISLPGVSLGPGTYVFEIVESASTLDIIRVMSSDRKHVYLTTFTHGVRRPASLPDDRQITFAEVRAGLPPRVSAWYPMGESLGHQFVYSDAQRRPLGN
jgi:hypothetical protein